MRGYLNKVLADLAINVSPKKYPSPVIEAIALILFFLKNKKAVRANSTDDLRVKT